MLASESPGLEDLSQRRTSKWGIWGAVIGLLIALASLAVALLAFDQDKRFNAPNVTIEMVALNDNEEVEGTAESAVPVDGPPVDIRHRDATIEVTLENDGGSSARLTGATAQIEQIAQLTNCTDLGGPITTTYQFDVAVPRDARAPISIDYPLSFEVPASSFDQLALTVGPESEIEGMYPSVYLLDVEFETSVGTSVTTPPLALLSSIHGADRMLGDLDALGHPEYFNAEMRDALVAELRDCLNGNLQELERVTKDADQVSPELKFILDEYTSVLR